MTGRLAPKVVKRIACRILVERAEGRRPFALPRRRWEYNIKVGLKQMGCLGVNVIRLAQDKEEWWAIVKTKMSLRLPSSVGNSLTIGGTLSFSK